MTKIDDLCEEIEGGKPLKKVLDHKGKPYKVRKNKGEERAIAKKNYERFWKRLSKIEGGENGEN